MPSPTPLVYPWPEVPAPGEAFEVAPGLRWIRMPLPFALDHINLWLVDDETGLIAIDTGYAAETTRSHWESILAADGRPIERVVVTHCHPDHLGLATWLAEPSKAPIHMTQGEFLVGHALWHQLPGYGVPAMVTHFGQHGLDASRCQALADRGNAYRRGIAGIPDHFRRLMDGQRIALGRHEWEVICGYGHSPEHAALHCADLGVLISGDMLLPRISTNISVYAAFPDDDPLGWFLASLERFKDLPADTLVLPSHGRPFRGIETRVDELIRHHEERCADLLKACAAPKSAGDLLSTLFPRELDTHQVMFAMGENIAHLNYLAVRGALARVESDDDVVRYRTNH